MAILFARLGFTFSARRLLGDDLACSEFVGDVGCFASCLVYLGCRDVLEVRAERTLDISGKQSAEVLTQAGLVLPTLLLALSGGGIPAAAPGAEGA